MSDNTYRRLFGQETDPYDGLFGPSAAKDEWVRKGIVEINTRTGEKRAARKSDKAVATVPSSPRADKPDPAREEAAFQAWYAKHAKELDLDPNPDDPRHQYDYRAAYRAGIEPDFDPTSGEIHWDSRFKAADHPNRYVGIIDTKTGKPRQRSGLPAIGKVDAPKSGVLAALKETPRMVAASAAENLASLADIPQVLGEGILRIAETPQVLEEIARQGDSDRRPRSNPLRRRQPSQPGDALPEPARKIREKVQEFYDESVQRYADATSSLPAPLAAGAYLATETAGNLLDPTNLLGAGVVVDAARPVTRDMAVEAAQRLPEPRSLPTPTRTITPALEELQRASLAIGEEAPVAAVADAMAHAGSDVSPEAINRVARGERYYRLRPDGTPVPILNDVSAVDVKVNSGEVKVRVDASGRVDIEAGRLNPAQQRALADLSAEKTAAPSRDTPASDEPLALEEVADEDAFLASLGVRRPGSSGTTKSSVLANMPVETSRARSVLPAEEARRWELLSAAARQLDLQDPQFQRISAQLDEIEAGLPDEQVNFLYGDNSWKPENFVRPPKVAGNLRDMQRISAFGDGVYADLVPEAAVNANAPLNPLRRQLSVVRPDEPPILDAPLPGAEVFLHGTAADPGSLRLRDEPMWLTSSPADSHLRFAPHRLRAHVQIERPLTHTEAVRDRQRIVAALQRDGVSASFVKEFDDALRLDDPSAWFTMPADARASLSKLGYDGVRVDDGLQGLDAKPLQWVIPFNARRQVQPIRSGINPEAGFIKADMLSSLDRWITENLNSGGMFKAAAKDFTEPAQKEFVAGLPKKLEGMQGSYQVQMDDMRRHQSDLLSGARAAGLRGDRLRQAMEDVTAVRLGEKTLDSLPETMREPALAMFDQFDMLTNEMVDSGMLTEAQKEVVTGNFGNYVHRAYEMFDDQQWAARHAPPGAAPTGGSPQWENAFSYLRGELGTADKVGSRVHLQDGRSGRITSLTDDGRAFVRFDDGQLQMVPRASLSGATDDQIAGILRGLIDREGGAMRVLTVPGGPRQLNAILQQRQAIPAPLRELMGEYKDFRVVAERTVHNMAWDLAAHRFFKETADEGAALGVFRPKGDPSGLVYAKIVGEGQDTLGSRGALAELLTTPGLKKALEGTFEEVRSTWWSRMAGRVKAMKTVGSIQTQARNFLSHGITTLANGHNPGDVVRYRQVGQILSGKQLATRRRAVQLGIINEGAASREIESYVRDLEKGGAVSQLGARISKPFVKMYKTSDDFWRTYNWLLETEDMMAARGLSRPEAEALAADRVRDTFQTYGRAPLLADKLRRNPLVGVFPTFYIESVRNIGNLARIGATDIREGVQTGNQALVRVGMKKYLGLSAAIGSAYAVAQATRDEVGVSKQEEDAFRRLVAPAYMQNAELIFTAKEDGKSYTAFDWSFLNPYSALSKPVVAARRSMEQGKLPVQAVYELLESIAGGEILATVLAETVANQKIQDVYPFRLGGKISLPDQGLEQVSKDKAYHLYRAMAPGSITSGENILRGAGVLSSTTETGKKYNLGTELLALAGPRVTTYEVAPSVKRQSVEAAVALRELTSDARRTVERVPDSLDEQAEVWVNAQERVYDRVRQMAQDGLTLKLERRDLFKTMRDGLLPPDWAARAMAGEEVPPPPNLEPRTDMERELLRRARELWEVRYRGGPAEEGPDPYEALF